MRVGPYVRNAVEDVADIHVLRIYIRNLYECAQDLGQLLVVKFIKTKYHKDI